MSFTQHLQQNFKRALPFIAIWLIASFIGCFFRLYPLRHHVSNDSTEKATLLVLSNLRKKIRLSIEKINPHLSQIEKNRLAKEQFDKLLHAQSNDARQTINRVAKELDIKNTKASPFPYLLASDSYYYLGLTENILNTGRTSDTFKGSKYLNKLMTAPDGYWEPFNLHPYIGFTVHKIISVFRPQAPLIFTVGFTPLLIAILSLIPFLVICKDLRCSSWASLTGSIYFILAPIFLKRSMFGWYDNDPYNTLFPLTILAIVFHGLIKRRNLSKTILWAVLTCLSICCYALFWQGWVFLESIIIASGVIIIIHNHFIAKHKEETKSLLTFFGIILGGTFLGIGIIFGITEFFTLFQEGWTALKNFLTPQLSLWPDLYIGVGELRKASLSFIIGQTGGATFFYIALLGLFVPFIKAFRHPKDETFFDKIIVAIFLAATIIITLGAERFALLCLIPLSILFTLGVQVILNFFQDLIQNKFPARQKPRLRVQIMCTVISLGLIIFPFRTTVKNSASLLNKIFNDTWANVLSQIKEETPSDSIINSWWPPGHFITSMAKRKVTFDGATINKPQAYWMANVLLSQNEKDALGILRMLNNSANRAADYLTGAGFDLSQAVDILKRIMPLNASQARATLTPLMETEKAQNLLTLTHKTPPPSYLMLYNELVEKNIQLSFVGKWDFKKIEEINQNPSLRKLVPPSGSKSYVSFLWEISGGHPKYSETLNLIGQTKETVIFQHNVKINFLTKACTVDSSKFGQGVPLSLFYQEGDEFIEKRYPKASLPYSVVLFRRQETYQCVLMDRDIAKSLVVRLFFFNGVGLKHLKPFILESDLTKRTKILVYEIDWESFLNEIGEI